MQVTMHALQCMFDVYSVQCMYTGVPERGAVLPFAFQFDSNKAIAC